MSNGFVNKLQLFLYLLSSINRKFIKNVYRENFLCYNIYNYFHTELIMATKVFSFAKSENRRNLSGNSIFRIDKNYSYLSYCFIIPAVLYFLIYLSMGLHPFGDGSVLVLDLNGQYVYFYEALRNAVMGDNSLLYSFARQLGGEFLGIYAYYVASPFPILYAFFRKAEFLKHCFAFS